MRSHELFAQAGLKHQSQLKVAKVTGMNQQCLAGLDLKCSPRIYLLEAWFPGTDYGKVVKSLRWDLVEVFRSVGSCPEGDSGTTASSSSPSLFIHEGSSFTLPLTPCHLMCCLTTDPKQWGQLIMVFKAVSQNKPELSSYVDLSQAFVIVTELRTTHPVRRHLPNFCLCPIG
jgi:hypothetical protein